MKKNQEKQDEAAEKLVNDFIRRRQYLKVQFSIRYARRPKNAKAGKSS